MEQQGQIDLKRMLHLARRYAFGMWRFRWIGIVVCWIAALSIWALALVQPPKYEASAQVYVNTDSLLKPLLRGLSVEPNVMDHVALMTRTLLTRPHLESVARQADFDIDTRSEAQFESLVGSLEERIGIRSSRENIYTISFADAQRNRAITVVDLLLDSFVEDSLVSNIEDTRQAERTLQSEIRGYEQRLVEAEDRLKEFKRKNVGLMPDDGTDYYGRLEAAKARLADLERQIRVEREKALSIERQLGGMAPAPEEEDLGLISGPAAALNDQIAAFEKRKADLLLDYTERHPEVQRLEQALEDLYERRKGLVSMSGNGGLPDELSENPIYQNLRIEQSKVELALAELRAKRADLQEEVDELESLVNVVPEVEAELNRLNRDYDVVKSRYTAMLQRWEDLQTGMRVETSSDQVQFRVVSPPYAPLQPVGPERALFIAAGGLFALGAGIGLALLLSLLRPVTFDAQDLAEFGLPVLGTVAMHRGHRSWFARSGGSIVLACLLVALVACTAVLAALSNPVSELVRSLLIS